MTPILRLAGVGKWFGETTAVEDLSLEVRAGELLTLLGPSGCGKTTTLRMIAGFETPTTGQIYFEGREITGLPPQRRGFGMVFQNYALFPHLDVFENVAFGLRGRGTSRAEIARRVGEALALVDLSGYERRRVQQLSGGQQQRIALARALAPEPRILLLDEPLSNLDATLRERTRAELRSLVERLGITAIFVTHDQEEAFELSDRIAIMEGGQLQQVGTPESLYQEPVNPFVASFIGRANFIDAKLIEREGEWLTSELPGGTRWRVRGDKRIDESPAKVLIMVRPEALEIAGEGLKIGEGDLYGKIVGRRFAGPTTIYRIEIEGAELTITERPDAGRVGDRVIIRLRPDALPLALARGDQKVSPSPTVTVGV